MWRRIQVESRPGLKLKYGRESPKEILAEPVSCSFTFHPHEGGQFSGLGPAITAPDRDTTSGVGVLQEEPEFCVFG